jgi:hypothetical protein
VSAPSDRQDHPSDPGRSRARPLHLGHHRHPLPGT